MAAPKTMRALGQTRYGGTEVLEELSLAVPEPTGSDLRVRVRAVGINPVDAKVRSNWGNFGDLQGSMPVVTGWDAAGVVDAVGPQADGRFKVGDDVFYAGSVARKGCHSEYALVDSRIVGRKPRSLSFAEAAALPLTALTVWEVRAHETRGSAENAANGSLFAPSMPSLTCCHAAPEPAGPQGCLDHAGLGATLDAGRTAQKTALVLGGAGGVGSIAIQILKRVAGARVVATASRPESTAFAKDMGADVVVDHSKPLGPQLKDVGIEAVDLVLHTSDPDGNFDEVAALVAPLGRIVCILPISRPVDTAPLFSRSVSLVYELMFTRGLFGVDLTRQGQILDKLSGLVDAGVIKSTLVETLPWTVDGLRAAHDRIEGRHGLGKAVLVLPSE